MAAFNWIEFVGLCPNCKKNSFFKAQTHLAASFEGDEVGRFCNNKYSLGNIMRWFLETHIKHNEWNEAAIGPDLDMECCYSYCENCKQNLYVIIRFDKLIPREIIEIGLEEFWPEDFKK